MEFMDEEKKYKLIPLLGDICFPEVPVSCDLSGEIVIKTAKEAFEKNEEIVFVPQTKSPITGDVMSCINGVGCLSKIFDVREKGDALRIQVDVLKRVIIKRNLKRSI